MPDVVNDAVNLSFGLPTATSANAQRFMNERMSDFMGKDTRMRNDNLLFFYEIEDLSLNSWSDSDRSLRIKVRRTQICRLIYTGEEIDHTLHPVSGQHLLASCYRVELIRFIQRFDHWSRDWIRLQSLIRLCDFATF